MVSFKIMCHQLQSSALPRVLVYAYYGADLCKYPNHVVTCTRSNITMPQGLSLIMNPTSVSADLIHLQMKEELSLTVSDSHGKVCTEMPADGLSCLAALLLHLDQLPCRR